MGFFKKTKITVRIPSIKVLLNANARADKNKDLLLRSY